MENWYLEDAEQREDRAIPLEEGMKGPFAPVLNMWNEIHGSGRLPARADFPPEKLVGFLGKILLIEVHEQVPRFRFRLFGSDISQRFGRDLTGKGLEDLKAPLYREMVRRHYEEAVASGKPSLYEITGIREMRHRRYQRLLLPLFGDDARVTMLMAVSLPLPSSPV